jgi:hypothetical protein
MSTAVTPRTNYLTRLFGGTSAALIVVNLGLLSVRAFLRVRQGAKFKVEDWLLNLAFVSLLHYDHSG